MEEDFWEEKIPKAKGKALPCNREQTEGNKNREENSLIAPEGIEPTSLALQAGVLKTLQTESN
jgi:hypothetical protein